MRRKRHWLLSVAIFDPHGRYWAFRTMTHEGKTAVDAFISLRDYYEDGGTTEYDRAYASAVLIGAWPITAEQAERLS